METPKHEPRSADSSAIQMWEHTLSQIPTTFGKLVYISSLRDVNTGCYQHHGLAQMFGADEAAKTLRESHRKIFAEWLSYDLPQQKQDLERYLSSFHIDKRTILATWIRLTPYRNLIPTDAGDPERKLYLADFEAILELLRNEHDVALTDPDA